MDFSQELTAKAQIVIDSTQTPPQIVNIKGVDPTAWTSELKGVNNSRGKV